MYLNSISMHHNCQYIHFITKIASHIHSFMNCTYFYYYSYMYACSIYVCTLTSITERSKVLCNLGNNYTYQYKFNEAEKCFKQALDIVNRNYNNQSQTWAIMKSEILQQKGVMKRIKGEEYASLQVLKQCTEIRRSACYLSNRYHPGK